MKNSATDDAQKIAEARQKLASPPAVSTKSATKRFVELLFDDIKKARATGKTWEEIAVDLSGARDISPDALRQVFAKLSLERKGVPARAKHAAAGQGSFGTLI